MKHGASTYTNRGCRCRVCRAANAARHHRWARSVDPDQAPHGTLGGYRNWGCRCDDCTRANSDAMREYRARKRVTA